MAFKSTDYPYDTVVYISDVIGGVRYRASGVLISPDEVLTASHVLYSSLFGAATSVQVSPGYNNGVAPFGTASASYFHYVRVGDAFGLITNASSQSDFAVIHLNRSFNVGSMAYAANYGGGDVHVTGFPASAGTAMVDVAETVRKDPVYSLLNGAPTGAGTSGGPVWMDRDGTPTVVGLVSSESSVTGYNVQITDAILQQISSWVYQDDYTDPAVDIGFYKAAYPDVAAGAFTSASYHYHASGWHEGRNPNGYFSTTGYLGANKDILQAGVDPLTQYDQFGWKEGRDPAANFDTSLYLLHNPDVVRAGVDPLMHFLTAGRLEGRAAYAAIGPASSIVGGFDPEFYLLANPDVALAGVDAAAHFYSIGWREGRNPNAYFDTGAYLNAYGDVRAAGMNPLVHYDQSGWREGRDPSVRFDTRSYLAAYGDVAGARVDPLQHYLHDGANEGRVAFADGTLFK